MQGEQGPHEEVPRASSLLQRVATAVSIVGGWLAGIAVVAILLLTAAAVFGRYLLNEPLRGADEATGFLVVFVVMFGAAEALRRGDHIAIDLLYLRAGPRSRLWLEGWAMLGVLLFSVLLFITAWDTVVFARQFGAYSTGALELPLWIPQSAMLVGAALLGFAALARLLRYLAGPR
jgi:TRAP-type C4-dicarboxylate transport system permease small subunit